MVHDWLLYVHPDSKSTGCVDNSTSVVLVEPTIKSRGFTELRVLRTQYTTGKLSNGALLPPSSTWGQDSDTWSRSLLHTRDICVRQYKLLLGFNFIGPLWGSRNNLILGFYIKSSIDCVSFLTIGAAVKKFLFIFYLFWVKVSMWSRWLKVDWLYTFKTLGNFKILKILFIFLFSFHLLK